MKYLLYKQSKSVKESNMSRVTGQMAAKDNQNVIVKSKYFQNCASKKSKRFRIAFTTEQINYLEREFSKFPYIGSGTRKDVSDKLKIPERAVKIWFQNRRMREKKEGSKDFEMEDITRDTTKTANEPLINNTCNWQSNNDNHCGVVNMKPLAPNVPTCVTVNPKLCTITKSPVNPKVKGDSTNNYNNTSFVPTNNTVKTTPVSLQNPKKEPNVTLAPLFKQKTIYPTPSKKQSKGPANHCPSTKSNSNTDQDVPQDLSSKNLNKLHTQQPYPSISSGIHYPVNTAQGPRFIPMHIPNAYPPPTAFPTGHVIWRPVNMLSTLPVPQPSPVSMGIPQNSTGVHLVNSHVKDSCSCSCNCHGSNSRAYNQHSVRAHPQYILAIPFSEPHK
ncbi:retinal homeobox protein Rx2-like [Bicyclus anynana]|uniref:Retinal homeobox protein Rx2-like n=1 Tax=Bicyclus anynana TaxID=110368 RepID=A0A6J1P8I6_BICAN|nr:retinal homeobox protein Rx2-like [Bicyclus anynana]